MIAEASRRHFLKGFAALLAAPALLRLIPGDAVTTINASWQSGASLVVHPLTGVLHAGDILTINGVKAVNRTTGQPAEYLRQFVVTAAPPPRATVIHLYPRLIPLGQSSATVDRLPRNGARVDVVVPLALQFHPESKPYGDSPHA